MEPELADGEGSAHDPGADQQVGYVGKDRPCEEEPHVHLRIPEYPSEQPQGCPQVPEEHGSGDEDPPTMDAPGDVGFECLDLLGG